MKTAEKSRKALMNALSVILTSRDYGSVTVQMIASKAGLGRKEFYYYFASKDELLDITAESKLEGCRYEENGWKSIERLSEIIFSDAPLFSAYLSTPESGKLCPLVEECVGNIFKTGKKELVKFISDAVLSYMRRKVCSNEKITSAEFMGGLKSIFSGIGTLIEENPAECNNGSL